MGFVYYIFNKKIHVYFYPITSYGNITNGQTELEIFRALLENLKKLPNSVRKYAIFDFHGIEYLSDIINCKTPKIRTKFCGFSQNQYVILPNGDVKSCWWGYDLPIFDHAATPNRVERDTNKIKRCLNCKYQFICGGGCAYKEFITTGNINYGYCADFDGLFTTYLQYIYDK